jgi:hypothetical protein
VTTSYRDLDDMQDTQVDLQFGDALSSLPPPKKKTKTDKDSVTN